MISNVVNVNHAGLDYYDVGWHKYSQNTEEPACKKLTYKKLQPEVFAIRYPDIQQETSQPEIYPVSYNFTVSCLKTRTNCYIFY